MQGLGSAKGQKKKTENGRPRFFGFRFLDFFELWSHRGFLIFLRLLTPPTLQRLRGFRADPDGNLFQDERLHPRLGHDGSGDGQHEKQHRGEGKKRKVAEARGEKVGLHLLPAWISVEEKRLCFRAEYSHHWLI